jgi:uncharacterized protein YjdB
MLDVRTWPFVIATLMVASSVVADVAPPTLRSLTIVPEVASIDEGDTTVFVAIGTYVNGVRKVVTNKARWSSSNRKLATVAADGTATGITHGKVTIKAVIDKIEARGELTIEPRLMSLSVAPRSTTLAPGESYAFTVRGRYSDGKVRLLTEKASWSVDGDAATIDATGRAAAIGSGTATIVASVQNLRATAEVLVVEPSTTPAPASTLQPEEAPPTPSARPAYLQSVSIEPAVGALPERETQRLTATGLYSDGTVRDITSEVVWASTDVQVARVGLDGTVLGVRFGTATIAGTLQTYSGVATLTVTPIMVRIAILPEALSIKHRANGRVSAVATWSDDSTRDVTDEVTWTSSDDGVASVSLGSIQGIAPGSASITATLDDFRTSAAITVEPLIQSIAIQPQFASLTIGQTQQLTATATFSDGSTKDVTYSATWSQDSAAVTVSSTGLVTAAAEGSATVSARFDSVDGVATISVSKPAEP